MKNKNLLILFLALIFCVGIFLSYKHSSENPKAEWDTSPDTLIISTQFFIPRHVDYNYIPDVRVWGDGYIVWVEHKSDGSRKVFEGYLSQEEMKDLIEQFIDAGFFKWFEDTESFSDALWINLSDASRSKQFDANERIEWLVDYLMEGAGVVPKEYNPTSGYLYVVPAELTGLPDNTQPQYSWPEEEFGFDLASTCSSGESCDIEVTDEELLLAWDIINNSNDVVSSKGKNYWISIVIPEKRP